MCTHTTRAKRFRKKQRDFFTRQTRSISSNSTTTTREREREKKRDEKKNTNRDERSNRVRLPGPPLSISRHKNYKCYSLLSLTDKPAGAGDANLQLLLRPVRLGAVDPSQGVLLARGVRSFRISHSSRVIVSRCRVFVVGTKKEDNKKCSTSEEGTLFREHEKSTLALFPLLFALKKKAEEAEGREERVFFIFFCCVSPFEPFHRQAMRKCFARLNLLMTAAPRKNVEIEKKQVWIKKPLQGRNLFNFFVAFRL